MPGAIVIKLFSTVICCHSMEVPSVCVIKIHYLGNYLGMELNYHSIVLNIGPDKTIPNTSVIYRHILTLEKEGLTVIYRGTFTA
jgi:small basic protein